MTQNCYSMRPGTRFGFRGEVWIVTTNDTLNRTFTAKTTPNEIAGQLTKRFRYPDSNEISVRSVPFNKA